MSSLNNFQPSNIRRTPYSHSLIASNASNQQPNQQSNQSIMDVFSTPVQSAKISSINKTPSNSNLINNNLKLEPGFVSSNSTGRLNLLTPSTSLYSNSHINLNSYTPNNTVFMNSRNAITGGTINNTTNNTSNNTNTTNTTATNNNNNTISSSASAPIKRNHYHSNSIGNSNSNNNNLNLSVNTNFNNSGNNNTNVNPNYHSHSRYPSDVTDNTQNHENYEHSNFILNTPERALLSLPNPIQLPHSYIHQTKNLNQYSPYESIPSSLNSNSHVHSLSLDTVTSTYSNKSISNDDWYNNNNKNNNNNNPPGITTGGGIGNSIYSHRHTFSNSSSIINNNSSYEDSNLMDLAKEYAESSLEDLAIQLKEIENQILDSTSSNIKNNSKENKILTIQRKKQQQLFALVSLIKIVRISENSVCPRNVVYSRYVEICKKFNINQICNAAFGKLVKVFCPGIKTRRLGVRGSSRYNYCGIELIDNTEVNIDDNDDIYNWNIKKEKENNDNDDHEVEIEENSINNDDNNNSNNNNGESNEDIDIKIENNDTDDKLIEDTNLISPIKLAFNDHLFTKLDNDIEFTPNFNKFINNSNIKNSHKIILENYCKFLNLIFNDWRYLKIESLFNKIDNFKFENILNEEYFTIYEIEFKELEPLINYCNLEIFKSSIKLISKIIFQQVPENVQNTLCNFEKSFIFHIKNMKIKKSLIDENIKIAKKFIGLISRLRKVVFLSSNLSKLLSNNETKLSFCNEWDNLNISNLINKNSLLPKFNNIEFNKINKICEYLINIIKSLNFKQENNLIDDSISKFRDKIIKNLSISFATIPIKFKNIKPKDLLIYIELIGSNILRELTVENCTSSFSVWWSIICWCNEYMLFMAEIGGFLD
ncbi:hypothetical protein C6P42_000325 [Pichia californica]|nr:hypothetical protein C6P42_000325 [[Candida] californica]